VRSTRIFLCRSFVSQAHGEIAVKKIFSGAKDPKKISHHGL